MALDRRVVRKSIENPHVQTGMGVAMARAVVENTGLMQLHEPQTNQGFAVFDDEVPTILVKFQVKSETNIPKGITVRKTGNRDEIHGKDAKELGKAYLAKMGRLRPNRKDTGEDVLQHGHVKQDILACLRGAGFKMVDLHYYFHTAKQRYIIQLVMARTTVDGITFQDLSEAEADAIRTLEAKAWGVHVWDNRSTYDPMTINFAGGQTPGRNVKMLRIKAGEMRVYDE